jgi:sugar-specific transcriptional regulator TrmB
LSEESIKETLNEFGLTKREAEVYIFLAKHGVLKVREISKQTKMPNALVYRILKSLERKGVVEATLESPVRFAAIAFETVLEMSIRAKREEAEQIEKKKRVLLEDWKRISKTELEPESAKFTVIEGTRKIYRKIAEVADKTQESLSATLTITDLARAEQFGVFDSAYDRQRKTEIEFLFLTEVDQQNIKAFEMLSPELKNTLNIKARNADLSLVPFTRMIIRDNQEILFFISSRLRSKKKREACIYTNCSSLVSSYAGIFEELWVNSTSIEDKISEIETGKLAPRTTIIADEIAAKAKFIKTLQDAKKEIMLSTSTQGLVQLSESKLPLEEIANRNIKIKILAPITNENLQSAKRLLKYCEVRHFNWFTLNIERVIIDGKHLFQFKGVSTDENVLETIFSFKNAIYTTDLVHVEKTRNLLEKIWDSAYSISEARFHPVTEVDLSDEISLESKRDLKTLPERLFREANTRGMARAVFGQVTISPPKQLNMPDTRITVMNVDKETAPMGGGDMLRVDLWLNTPKGEAFVPVAVITNGNPKVFAKIKAKFKGLPAAQNIISVKPEELQAWVEGRTFFVGWTVPIPLIPPKYVLDPACILFEAFGDELHMKNPISWPSGWVEEMEMCSFQAFTTYVGTSWKYSGPGINGMVGNLIWIDSPPKSAKKE